MTAIKRIDAWNCRVPLDVPVRFKWGTITHRDYAVVRIQTSDGLEGHGLAISRGAPIDVAVVDMIAPLIIGMEAEDVGAIQAEILRRTASGDRHGILANARSLVDIALWDIRGRAMESPIWRLLGGNRQDAGVLLVEGYELPNESDEDFAARLAKRAADGYPVLKLEAAGYDDYRVLQRRLQLIRQLAGPDVQLVVDVNGAWTSVREAADAINTFATVDLAWVEDPFPRHQLHDIGKLRGLVETPLAAGDDITDPRALYRLIQEEMVDVLRVDATTLGGIGPTADVIGFARQHGVTVSGHAYPSVHQHLTFAWPDMPWVEAFPDELPFEPSHKLLTQSAYSRLVNGRLSAPEAPGLGTELRMEAVERFSLRHGALGGDNTLVQT